MKYMLSEIVGPNIRGRLLGRWKDRVKEYICERVIIRRGKFEQTRKECFG